MTRHPERRQALRRARLVAALLVALVGFFAAQGAAADAAQTRAVTIEVDDGRFTELKPIVVSSTSRSREGPAIDVRPDGVDRFGSLLVVGCRAPDRPTGAPSWFGAQPRAFDCVEPDLRAPGVERGPPRPSLP
jgi:hypothetical protein